MDVNYSGNTQDQLRGKELIQQGKVGCIILAGGQGTRLGFDGPKGCMIVTSSGKSLFQLFCERAQGPICIMTSPLNHIQTVDFFEKNHFFNLDPSQVSFFQQEMLPLLDDQFQPTQEVGPDGNGHALHHFYRSGLWKKWHDLGIEYLNVIFVDNALADPFDPELVGLASRKNVDAILKAVPRLSAQEKMGMVTMQNGKLKVIEYFEISQNTISALSSTGMFCLSMSFIHYLTQELKAEFPLHLARKKGLWKRERFLFDLLDFARSGAVLVCERDKIYCPLKNASGEHSLETVRLKLDQISDTLL